MRTVLYVRIVVLIVIVLGWVLHDMGIMPALGSTALCKAIMAETVVAK